MGKRVRVVLSGQQNRNIMVDADATEGATIGKDLRLPDGTVATYQTIQQYFGGNTTVVENDPNTPSITLWELILNIPAIVAAIVALAANGFLAIVDYATGTVAARTITGETGRIVVTNGNGVAGNPTITLGPWPTVKPSITTGEAYTIPTGHQMLVHDVFLFDGGTLTLDGDLIVL